MENTTMMKKEYLKPVMEIMDVDNIPQILAASAPPSVSASGLDLGEELVGGGPEGLPLPADTWNQAW